jgi:seryl-tRNA synthetase
MLDIKFLKENKEQVKKSTKDKGFNPKIVDQVIDLYDDWTAKIRVFEELQHKRNEIASSSKGFSAVGKQLKEDLKAAELEVSDAYKKYLDIAFQVPNPASPDVKVGKGEADNEVIKTWGEIPKFDFGPKDHLVLGTNLGILDFESGAKVVGSQFYYLYGDGALLELALIQYAFETLSKEGFLPVITPDLAKSRYYLGTGYMPKGDEAQTYEIKDSDLGLIATAEVTLAGKHADEIIPEEKLPIKYIGYSHVFRQEGGSYGKYSKGMYRVHEFSKAEMFIYCKPEDSNKLHDYLLEMEEKIYQGLGIPYRVIKQCTGDLGAMAARKYDIEAWMPGRGDYGEVTSTSNCTDYQARNLNIKFKKKDGKNEYLHMLNGTAIATSRTPIAILENFQQKDGSVLIPKVLQKWMGKEKIG